jgi:hypothetical protein
MILNKHTSNHATIGVKAMKKLVAITVLSFLIISSAIAFMPKTYAQDPDDPMVWIYDISGNPCDEFTLGASINITAYCGNTYLPFQMTIKAPNGTIVYTKTGINTNSWTAIFANMTDRLGDWEAELLGTGGVVREKGWASQTYLVVPEVPLGVIATLAACLSGFGLFKIRRRKK